MKKLLIVLIAGMLTAACSNEDDFSMESTKSEKTVKSIRSYDEALEIAREAVSIVENGITTRGYFSSRVVDKNNSLVIHSTLTRSESANYRDTLLYVFNYANNMGFAVVSANPETEGLIAVTESGTYTVDTPETDDTGLNDFMKLAEIYVQSERGGGTLPITPIFTIDTLVYDVLPLIPVKWGQRNYAGNYCPNGIAGCAPLAAAMIMSYYQYPQNITLTYSNADISVQTLNWTDIRNHKLYFTIGGVEQTQWCTASDSAHNAMGRLCRQIGQLFESSYNSNSTSTLTNKIRPGMINLGYTCSNWQSYSSNCSKSHIDNNKPLYFVGFDTDSGGHAWIVDGYEEIKIVKTYYQNLEPQEITSTIYNHVNWGWEGRNNGYFLDGVFATANATSFDSNPYPNTANYNFNSGLQYFVPSI